jgi:hypothetical protein
MLIKVCYNCSQCECAKRIILWNKPDNLFHYSQTLVVVLLLKDNLQKLLNLSNFAHSLIFELLQDLILMCTSYRYRSFRLYC